MVQMFMYVFTTLNILLNYSFEQIFLKFPLFNNLPTFAKAGLACNQAASKLSERGARFDE